MVLTGLSRFRLGWACVIALCGTLLLVACGGGGSSTQPDISITTQPADTSVLAGTNARFTVGVAGSATVQWQAAQGGGWQNIAGATGSELLLVQVQNSDTGKQYRAQVTSLGNVANVLTSSTATLTVQDNPALPVIVSQPADLVVQDGQAAAFSVTAQGTNLSLQWQRSRDAVNWADVPAANGTTLSLASVAVADSGSFWRLNVRNELATVASRAALLTVLGAPAAPSFSSQPESQSAVAGRQVIFNASVQGSPLPSLQWQTSPDGSVWTDVTGAQTATLVLNQVTLAQNGSQVRLQARNSQGEALSQVATLTVLASGAAPTISQQPQPLLGVIPAPVSFSVVAQASPSPRYQWQVAAAFSESFVNINGATSATLTLPQTSREDQGKSFRVVVSNSEGSLTSSVVKLSVAELPTIQQHPASTTFSAYGDDVGSFSVVASSFPAFPAPTYQWERSSDGGSSYTDVAGATQASVQFTVAPGDRGQRWRVKVSNAAGTTTSDPAIVGKLAWEAVGPSAGAQTLSAVQWVDGDIGVAVGEANTFSRTSDAGQTWTVVQSLQWSLTGRAMHALAFASPSTSVAVGNLGEIMRSSDAGQSWVTVRAASGISQVDRLNSVAFLSPMVGTTVGHKGVVLRTADAGLTWQVPALPAGLSSQLNEVSLRGSLGVVVGQSGTLLRSADGGASWSSVSLPTSGHLRSVRIVDDQTVVVVGDGGLGLRSSDAGVTWSVVSTGVTGLLSNLTHDGGSTLLACLNGPIPGHLRSSDAGSTWTVVASVDDGVSNDCKALSLRADQQVLGLWHGGQRPARSTNGGANWQYAIEAAKLKDLKAVAFNAQGVGVVVGQGGVIQRSGDAGQTWQVITNPSSDDLLAVGFAEARQLVAGGANGRLLGSSNGGQSWTVLSSPTTQAINGLAFGPSRMGLAVSAGGEILRSTDGGANWTVVYTAPQALRAVTVKGTRAVALGASGLWVSQDSGQTWAAATAPSASLWGIAFASTDNLVAVGELGASLRSSDGGLTWVAGGTLSHVPLSYNAVQFNSQGLGFAVGMQSSVDASTNNGQVWRGVVSQHNATLSAIAFADPALPVAVGQGGVILRGTGY